MVLPVAVAVRFSSSTFYAEEAGHARRGREGEHVFDEHDVTRRGEQDLVALWAWGPLSETW